MDKKSILGFVLIGAIVLAYAFWQKSQQPPIQPKPKQEVVDNQESSNEKEPQVADSNSESTIDTSIVANEEDSAGTAAIEKFKQDQLKKDFGLFYTAVDGEEGDIKIENDVLTAWVSKKGGYISKVELKNYHTYKDSTDTPLNLFIKDSSYYQINFTHANKSRSTKEFYFEPSSSGFVISGEDKESISMKLLAENDPSRYIEFTYSLKGNDYMLDFDVNVVGLSRDILGKDNGLDFQWEQYTPNQEKSIDEERKIASVFYYLDDEDTDDYLTEVSSDENEEVPNPLQWISFKQNFFASTIIADGAKIKGAHLKSYYEKDTYKYVKKMTANFPVEFEAGKDTHSSYKMYFGPNDYHLLSGYDLNLEDQINLGWGIFGWVNKYLFLPIFDLLYGWGIGVGICIIILTIVIKMMLFPITYKNYKSSAKMRVIRPLLDKLNEENKDADPMKKQQATMELYKQTGVNPMAGCLPALLQMPILIALYRLFPGLIELRGESFLWAEDLSTYDSPISFSRIDFLIFDFDHISIFTVLLAISLFFYTRMNNQMTPSAASTGGGDMQQAMQKQMKIMMNFMPLMMLFFFNSVAAGLTLYYFLANLTSIGQTLVIKKYFIDEEAILAKIEDHKKKPMKKSKFQKKLEEMQKQRKI